MCLNKKSKIKYLIFIFLIFILILYACQQNSTLVINDKEIIVEIANTQEKRARGLMYRKELDDNHGMLFIFDEVKEVSFWMKNTFIPLSIAFIDTNYKIVGIKDMLPLDEESRHSSFIPVKYALEVNQGWFDRNSIRVGATVRGIK